MQFVFAAVLAVAAAAPGLYGGAIAAPLTSAWGHGAVAAPLTSAWGHGAVVGAPLISTGVVKAAVPVATSYANTVRVSYALIKNVLALARDSELKN